MILEKMMDLFSLIIGIALGAAFSPFWMKVWSVVKDWVTTTLNKKPEEK